MTMLGSTGSTGHEGSPRVLVAEDDRSVRESLVMALGLDGYDVHAVSDGEQALEAVLTSGDREPDVIVLDVMMPFLDGLSVCRRLRARNVKTPILMLTARHEVADRVSGLDAGADDYLVKPFALDELLARVRALLRRGGGTEPVLRYADVELDPARGTALRAGQRLPLRPREHALLEYFLRHPEEVLTRSRIYEHVWESHYHGDSNVIEVYVRYLRTHLETSGERLIHTVRGRGYVLHRTWDE